MKTIKEFKMLLVRNDSNTLLGSHLNSLFNENIHHDASIQNLEEKIEVIVQMHKNGIDCFSDQYRLGSVTKAFYQVKLSDYVNF
jgi:hypothetical protein